MAKIPPKKTPAAKPPATARRRRKRRLGIQVAVIPQDLERDGPHEDVGVQLKTVLAGSRRVAEAGNIAGLFEGLMLCASSYGCGRDVASDDAVAIAHDELGVLVPRWIIRNALKYMRGELLAQGTCPTQKWRARFVRDMQFMSTLEAVETALDRGAKWTDGQVFEAVGEMDSLTPAQVEGRYKRGMREYKGTGLTKRHYVPMYIRTP